MSVTALSPGHLLGWPAIWLHPIFRWRAHNQVIWVNTLFVSANSMVNYHSGRNDTPMKFPGKTVRHMPFCEFTPPASNVERAIPALVKTTDPYPASVWPAFINFGPEPMQQAFLIIRNGHLQCGHSTSHRSPTKVQPQHIV